MREQIENPMVSASEPPEERVVMQCTDCDCDIYEGDDYYDIDGYIICIDCITDYKKEAVYDFYEGVEYEG
jgi:hypothetical protein